MVIGHVKQDRAEKGATILIALNPFWVFCRAASEQHHLRFQQASPERRMTVSVSRRSPVSDNSVSSHRKRRHESCDDILGKR